MFMAETWFEIAAAHGVAGGPPNRRRYPRFKCQLPTEIRTPNSQYPIQGETTDVSLCGCFVATVFAMPVGTEIDFRCWVGETAVACKAVVRTSDPGVGNGIEFLDLDAPSQEILGRYLDSLQESATQADEPSGVIRARA